MTQSLIPPGPFTRLGDTISAAPQPRLDAQGHVIPGAVSAPSLADLRPMSDPRQREAIGELFRAAPEVLAQRDDLARRLGEAINYIEHGFGQRAGVDDAAALRRLLDREVLTGLPLVAAFGTGIHHSEARFDIQGAKAAVALAQQDPIAGRMASYAQLSQIVERLASALDKALEAQDPREAIGSPADLLVKEAYGLLNQPYEPRETTSLKP